MRRKSAIATALLLLLLCQLREVSCYTLEGQWRLTPEHLAFTQDDPNVIFEFVNNIPQLSLFLPQDRLDAPSLASTHSGTKKLKVYACKTLLYNYYVNESSLYMQPIAAEGTNRPCLNN